MKPATTPGLSGRRAQAARNDQSILDSARAVFTADPGAPIAAVAEHAGVGIGALYRRYHSKEDLLRQLSLETLRRYIAAAEQALEATTDPWDAFAGFMRQGLEGGAGSLTLRFAGSFTPGEELYRLGASAHELTHRLLERTAAAGVLRSGLSVGDISLLFEQLQGVWVDDPQRTAELRQRYLALVLDGLRLTTAPPLPGQAPRWEEVSGRFDS